MSQCRGRKPRREHHPGKWAQQGESAEREANHRLGGGVGLLVTMTRAVSKECWRQRPEWRTEAWLGMRTGGRTRTTEPRGGDLGWRAVCSRLCMTMSVGVIACVAAVCIVVKGLSVCQTGTVLQVCVPGALYPVFAAGRTFATGDPASLGA